jgi:antitoxin ParD1/3/4
MARMNTSLLEGLKAGAERRVAYGNCSSTSDCARDIIARDRNRIADLQNLSADLHAGFALGVSDQSLGDSDEANRARGEAA